MECGVNVVCRLAHVHLEAGVLQRYHPEHISAIRAAATYQKGPAGGRARRAISRRGSSAGTAEAAINITPMLCPQVADSHSQRRSCVGLAKTRHSMPHDPYGTMGAPGQGAVPATAS